MSKDFIIIVSLIICSLFFWATVDILNTKKNSGIPSEKPEIYRKIDPSIDIEFLKKLQSMQDENFSAQ